VDQIQGTLAQQRKEIQSLMKQMNRQNEAQANLGRDAVRTDAVADVEFAEAMASRRASSIARARGLALIPAMSTIELRLLTYASSEQGGKFKALVITDVWDASFASVGIPAGALARGYIESAANDGDSRIRMTITEFVLPSGDSVQLRIPDAVTDPIGATGPKGEVNHKWGTRLGSTAMYVVVGTLSAVGSKSTSNSNAGFDDVLRQNLAGQMGQQGQSSFQSGMQLKPTVDLREGSVISMILGSNLYLVPWERLRPVIPAPNQTSAH
jgi:type IV secretory pathway VirB10-like protein